MNEYVRNTLSIKVNTPKGYKSFSGIRKLMKPSFKIYIDDGYLICSADHILYCDDRPILAEDIIIGTKIKYKESYFTVTKIEFVGQQIVYDLIDVSGGHIYYTNEFVSHNCSFSGSSFTLIEGKHLSKLTYQPTWDTRHNLPDVKIYEHPKEEHYYMLGVDTAKYGEGDFLSMQVIDVTSKPFKQVATFRRKDITYLNLVEPLYNLGTYYNNAYMFIENNSGDGQSTADLVSNNYDYENIYAEKSDIFGFRTTPKSRKIGLQNLKQLIEDDMLILNDEETYNELLRFSLKNGKYQAVDGYNDDSVMALVASLFFLQVKAWVDIEDLHKFFKGDSEESSDDDCFVFGFIDDGTGNMIPF